MIFLFDKFKKLKGTVRNRHTISLLYERERNGLYTVSAEIPLKITDKKTVYNYHKKVKDSDFLGHYDREGRFQLHKIASVDIEDSSIFIRGVHLFFDEAKAGAIIQEIRFRGSEIIDGARVAFDSIGWSVVDYDVSDTEDYIFYNVSPLEARAILVETFGYEFDYWLDFDGKNIRNKQISVKREMGKDSNKRYNYGHNVLNIKVEQDYSEIYTAVIGRGKGEDLGDDAYGRRIEYTDVEWKTPTHPMNKPKGSRVLHDENATQLFGYHEDGKVSPRTKVEIFEDIEEPAKLLRASYNWLRENSVPKAVFSLEVPDGDGLDLGDKVHVIYRDIDLVKHTRVTKVVDDLVSGNRDVEFGDTAYFKTDRRLSGVKSELKRVGGSMSSRISRLKAEFDKRFDDEVNQWKDDFEQAVIDAEAAVEVMRVTMTEEFEATQKAFEDEFNQSVAEAKRHADETAEAKAKQVQDNLDSFAGRHEQIVGELQGNIVDIDGELADARANVSDILGRLTIVDEDVSGIEGSLTEIEGTLTNTKTQLEAQITDARTALENSISTTRTQLENKIDTTEQALNKVGEDLGSAKTDLQNQLDAARAELDGLEVGGRNLLPSFTSDKWSHANLTEIEDYRLYFPSGHTGNSIIFLDVEPNTNYTMTFNSDYARYYIYEVLEDGSLGKIIRTTTGSETYTFNTEDISRIRVSLNTFSGNVHEEKNIWNLKLEKGTVATDWTPAPEDTEQKITNINQTISNIEGELSSKVEQTEVDALRGTVTQQGTLLTQTADEVSSKAEKSVVDTLTGRVSNTESSVTQNAAEIAKKLTKSVYDEDKKATDAKITQWSNTASETAEGLTRVIGRVSETEKGVETAQTRIEAEAGRIDGVLSRTSKVEGQVQDAQLAIATNADGLALRATKTEVEQAIDGIEVGGRNLVLDSEWNEGNSKYLFKQFETSEDLVVGEVYTITLYGELGEDRSYFRLYKSSGYSQFQKPDGTGGGGILSEVKEGVYQATFKHYFSEGYEPNRHDLFRIYQMASTDSSESYVSRVKLERGTKATDWTPAPEDIDASISEVTDRVTTAEAELVVQAGEISQRATQSELDRVTGRVSTAETSITQNANEIARRLVKSDYDSDKQETDAEITKWSNLTTETAEGLEQTISRVSTAEGKLSDAELSIKANADSLKLTATKTEVENAIDGIEVGGRNLMRNSQIIEHRNHNSHLTFTPTHAGMYTISFDYNIIEEISTITRFLLYSSASGVGSFSGVLPKTSPTQKRVSRTFEVTESMVGIGIYLYAGGNAAISRDNKMDFIEIKVEKGTKATDWTPAPEDTEAKITKAQADIIANAKEIALKASQSDLNSVTGRVSSAESQLSVQAGQIALRATKKELEGVDGRVSATEASLTVLDDEISSVVGRVSDNETDISSVVQDVGSITSTVATLEGDVASQGSQISQTNDVISSKVWLDDVAEINPNLIPFADTSNKDNVNRWESWTSGTLTTNSLGELYLTSHSTSSVIGIESSEFELVEGRTYTASVKVRSSVGWNSSNEWDYTYLMRKSGNNSFLGSPTRTTVINPTTDIHEWTFTVDRTENVGVMFGTYRLNAGEYARIAISEPKLEEGTERTLFMNAFSNIEQKANELSLKVAELTSVDGENFLTQSDISVQADRVRIGSVSIGSTDMASILSVSPSAIDMITDELNLTGNLNVKGQIEAITGDFIEGNFSRLWAAEFKAIAIDVNDIHGVTAHFEYLYTLNANIEKLVAQNVFTNEVKALSISAVDANIGSIRSKILTSDVIMSRHINSSNALIDKIFADTARFERMMAKSGFVRTLNTVTIDTDQITIRRPDGGRLISNGVLENSFAIQFIQPRFEGVGVDWSANYYKTTNTSYTTAAAFSYSRGGRYLTVEGYCEMRSAVSGAANTTQGNIRILEYSSGSRSSFTTIESRDDNNGNNQFFRIRIDMGVPQYEQRNFYVQFRTLHSGNAAHFRINQAYYHG